MQQFVVHYGEIGLKGKNRVMFEKQLVRNIQKVVKGSVKRVSGRMIVETRDSRAKGKLSRVFGIVNFLSACVSSPETDPVSQSRRALNSIWCVIRRHESSGQ